MEQLGHLYHIARALVLLNDTNLYRHIFETDRVYDIIGCLEYEPGAPRARHREWLQSHVRHKEVVPLSDPELRAKIQQTYIIGYVKDVVLPRALDDATFQTLQSLIIFNHMEVL